MSLSIPLQVALGQDLPSDVSALWPYISTALFAVVAFVLVKFRTWIAYKTKEILEQSVKSDQKAQTANTTANSAQSTADIAIVKMEGFEDRFRRQFDLIQSLRDELITEREKRAETDRKLEKLEAVHDKLANDYMVLTAQYKRLGDDHAETLRRVEAVVLHIEEIYASVEQEDSDIQQRIKGRLKTPRPPYEGKDRRAMEREGNGKGDKPRPAQRTEGRMG